MPPRALAGRVQGVGVRVEALPVEEHGHGRGAAAVAAGDVRSAGQQDGDEARVEHLAGVEGEVEGRGARHAHDVRVVRVEGHQLLQAGAHVAVRRRVGVHPGAAQMQHGARLEVQRGGVDGLQPQGVLAGRVHVLVQDPLQDPVILLLQHTNQEHV